MREKLAWVMCRWFKRAPGRYQYSEINADILGLPYAESQALPFYSRNRTYSTTPKLGETVPLSLHADVSFFSILETGHVPSMTRLVLVGRSKLIDLHKWNDWKALHNQLQADGLAPQLVFRNKPVTFDNAIYYPADLRVTAVAAEDSFEFIP